jgi:NAD(P) transhydrogenase subunit alpha
LAGYVAVILAAEALNRILPMMTTPSGTINPARVFVIGAGVAGLQAIATAKRLGARVEAYDIRAAVEEEVLSLGVRFIGSNQPQTEAGKGAYAEELKPEQQASEREKISKRCSQADAVISTARVFGRRAPVIITPDMVAGMKKGSVIVDLAVEEGGNVEESVLNEIVDRDGVKIIGYADLAMRVPVDASHMYSRNLANLIEEHWDQESNQFVLNLDDEIIGASLVTHEGQVCSQTLFDPI